MIVTLGLVFMRIVLFTENELIVKEEINNHNDNTAEDKGAGVLNKVKRKVEMNGVRDRFSKVVEWSNEAKKLGDEW